MAKRSPSEIWENFLVERTEDGLTKEQVEDICKGLRYLQCFYNRVSPDNLSKAMVDFWQGYELISRSFELRLIKVEEPDGDKG